MKDCNDVKFIEFIMVKNIVFVKMLNIVIVKGNVIYVSKMRKGV